MKTIIYAYLGAGAALSVITLFILVSLRFQIRSLGFSKIVMVGLSSFTSTATLAGLAGTIHELGAVGGFSKSALPTILEPTLIAIVISIVAYWVFNLWDSCLDDKATVIKRVASGKSAHADSYADKQDQNSAPRNRVLALRVDSFPRNKSEIV